MEECGEVETEESKRSTARPWVVCSSIRTWNIGDANAWWERLNRGADQWGRRVGQACVNGGCHDASKVLWQATAAGTWWGPHGDKRTMRLSTRFASSTALCASVYLKSTVPLDYASLGLATSVVPMNPTRASCPPACRQGSFALGGTGTSRTFIPLHKLMPGDGEERNDWLENALLPVHAVLCGLLVPVALQTGQPDELVSMPIR